MPASRFPSWFLHGVLLLDKPAGVTSSKLLDPLRQRLQRRARIGHAGTLDPFATGLVLALIGDATRLSRIATALPKSYIATVRFGIETDTLDPEGKVVADVDPGSCPSEAIGQVLESFRGDILQAPPPHSAVKVGGRRAYKLARAGKAPALEPRPVTIHRLRVRRERWPELELEVVCSAGTYVRSLARDLGRALALPASLTRLRRTRSGPFAVDGVVPLSEPIDLEDLREQLVSPARLALAAGLFAVEVPAEDARIFSEGMPLRTALDPPPPGTEAAVISTPADLGPLLIGIGRTFSDGTVRPSTVLAGARRVLEEVASPGER